MDRFDKFCSDKMECIVIVCVILITLGTLAVRIVGS